ncbi:MAG: penicillin-binding protein 2 [Candidatus Eremiobacteraeota bacterium]|nr:penicillin-binding protein 2 [Candidatus Eremiobacteraeota bacterium]
MKKRIEKLAFIFSLFFATLAVYLSFLQVIDTERYRHNRKNPRMLPRLEYRGRILDRRGETLAKTVTSGGRSARDYPQGSLFSPLIGYAHHRLGTEGIEKSADFTLAGKRLPQTIYEAFAFINGRKLAGQDIYLTLDSRMQKSARAALEGHRGAVVILNPATGELYALVSLPSYDPARIEILWERLKKDPGAPLVNRAIDGQYPPGSTFKVFTLVSALELGYVTPDDTYECTGTYELGSYKIHEAEGGSHGKVNLENALVHSCNIAFAQMGLKLDAYNFCECAKNFRLLEPFSIGGDIPVKPAHFPDPSSLSEGGLAQSAFGQGEITLSPLHLAIIVSAVAHEGKIMKPYLIKGIKSRNEENIYTAHPQVWCAPISKETADRVKAMMVQAVSRGTGTRAQVPGVTVAGKTGTAENPHGETHAWFVGFAPAEAPKLLVAAIVENGGYGGRVAAPIVGRILEECLPLLGEKP